MDPVFHWLLRLALALLFGAAAWHKARDLRGFAATIADYRILPGRLVPAAPLGLVAGELAAAGLLLGSAVAAPALTLLGAYSAAVAVNLMRGRHHIDCGCFGPAGRRTLSARLLARNAVLALAALAVMAPVGARSLTAVDLGTLGAGLAVLVLLFRAAERLADAAPSLAPGGSS